MAMSGVYFTLRTGYFQKNDGLIHRKSSGYEQ